ncbi:hypothetical protein ACP4OV_001529 [Aristida adscensionis]
MMTTRRRLLLPSLPQVRSRALTRGVSGVVMVVPLDIAGLPHQADAGAAGPARRPAVPRPLRGGGRRRPPPRHALPHGRAPAPRLTLEAVRQQCLDMLLSTFGSSNNLVH